MLDNTQDCVVRIDRDFRHIFANKALYSLTPEQYLGKTNEEIGLPEHLCSLWRKKHKKVFVTGQPEYFEFSFPTVKKGDRILQAAVCPEFNKNKEVETIISFMRDITDRKRDETILKNAKKQWESTFDAISDWVSIIDTEHTIIRSNTASKSLIGKSPQQIIGKCCYDFVHETDCPITDCPADRAFISKQRESMEIQLKDGRWFLVTVDPIKAPPSW